jgi:hypothetical protein
MRKRGTLHLLPFTAFPAITALTIDGVDNRSDGLSHTEKE